MNELDVAIKAAKEAGKIIKDRFRQENDVSRKKDNSLLSEADTRAEESITTLIKENFPDHSINAEESGLLKKSSKNIWLVDPLDGTTNFIFNVPFFCVSIAFVKGGKLQTGVVYDPMHEDLYVAESEKGATLNGKSISVSPTPNLKDSKISYARPRAKKEEFIEIFSKVEAATRTPKILGSMALHLAMVGSSTFEATILIAPNPWDAAAGSLIVQEAGGKVTDFEGKPWSLESENIVASNGKIHDQILEVLKS